ncbi:MAG: hypothetical protein RI935_471 [Candidatus Parcubacteria bacterium]|jgi:hypothetical protein
MSSREWGVERGLLRNHDFVEGNAKQTTLRADHILGGNLNSEFWRGLWDEVGTLLTKQKVC